MISHSPQRRLLIFPPLFLFLLFSSMTWQAISGGVFHQAFPFFFPLSETRFLGVGVLPCSRAVLERSPGFSFW